MQAANAQFSFLVEATYGCKVRTRLALNSQCPCLSFNVDITGMSHGTSPVISHGILHSTQDQIKETRTKRVRDIPEDAVANMQPLHPGKEMTS